MSCGPPGLRAPSLLRGLRPHKALADDRQSPRDELGDAGARAGLDAIVLFGGGTGLIGDPSGKTVERSLLPIQEAKDNVARHQALMT